MDKYTTIKELITIEECKSYGYSIRKIAQKVKISKSTVHRALKLLSVNISPIELAYQTDHNKHNSGRKLINLNFDEIQYINYHVVRNGYALDIIAHKLEESHLKIISTKTLYNMFNSGRIGFKVSNLLRKGKNKPCAKTETRGKINNHRTIHDQNEKFPDLKSTKTIGHLEGDTIVGKDHKSSIITLTDIWSKTTIPLVTVSQKSADVGQSLVNFILKLPLGTVKTITFDCGKEFSKWRWIEKICNIEIYFAVPGCPGQRGLNENNNGILRRYLPKSTDLSIHSQSDLNIIAQKINSTPRKSLNYKSSLDLIQLF